MNSATLRDVFHDPRVVPLHYARVGGLDIWPIVKTSIAMAFLDRAQGYGISRRKPLAARALDRLKALTAIAGDHERQLGVVLSALTGKSLALFANRSPCQVLAGVVFSPHLDPLRLALARRGTQSAAFYYDARATACQKDALPSFGIAAIVEEAFRSADRTSLPTSLRSNLREALLAAESTLGGIVIAPDPVERRIAATIKLMQTFKSIIRKSNMSAAGFVNYYSPVGWAGIAAANDAGLATFDIQHGLQGPGHHAYDWSELSGKPLNSVARGYLCWDERSATHLASNEMLRSTPVITIGPGSFRLEALLQEEADIWPEASISAAHRARCVEVASKIDRIRRPNIVGLFQQHWETSDWVEELRAALPESIALWVKSHPAGRKSRHRQKWLADAGLRPVNDLSLPHLLRHIDVVTTGYSAVGLEATWAGCPVVAYSPLADELLVPSCPPDRVRLSVQDPGTLARDLVQALPGTRHPPMVLPDIDAVAEALARAVGL